MATDESVISTAKVIAVTTGANCAKSKFIVVQGPSMTVRDCHAEVLAKRCLMSYLYAQLDLASEHPNGHPDLILQLDKSSMKYAVLPNVSFHLYVSDTPCGDARSIFTLNNYKCVDGENYGVEERVNPSEIHPNLNCFPHGHLQAKVGSWRRTIPVNAATVKAVQIKDSQILDVYMQSMSCCDKICRWNVLGLQGALLSSYMKPVYLSSIVIGSLDYAEHLSRAMYGRVATSLDGLPSNFRLNIPALKTVSNPAVGALCKLSATHASTWIHGDTAMEVMNTSRGCALDVDVMDGSGRASRVCKRELFHRFSELWKIMAPVLKFDVDKRGKVIEVPAYYYLAKSLTSEYRCAKEEMMHAFVSSGLGEWVKNPSELAMFCL